MKARIVSTIFILIILTSVVGSALAEDTAYIPKSFSEAVFGWEDNGQTYRLADTSVARVRIGVMDYRILCVAEPKAKPVFYSDRDGEINCIVYKSFVTDQEVLIVPCNGYDLPIAVPEYFDGNAEVEVLFVEPMVTYIKKFDDAPLGNNFEQPATEIEKYLPLDEVTRMLILMGHDWYGMRPPSQLEGEADTSTETQQPMSKAEELFGWKDTGETYKLAYKTIVKMTVDGIIKYALCPADGYQSVLYYNDNTNDTACFVYRDLVTGEEMFRQPGGRRPIASKAYFGPVEEVEVLAKEALEGYIEDHAYENYNELIERIKTPQTLDEVVETMLMITDDWYLMEEEEYIFSGNVPMDRKDEVLIEKYVYCMRVEFENDKKIMFVEAYPDGKGGARLKELFTGIDVSDMEYKNVNPVILLLLGIDYFPGKNTAKQYMSGMVSVYPELIRPVREARVNTEDGKRISVEGLAYVYDRLPDEVKIDFDRLKELAGE